MSVETALLDALTEKPSQHLFNITSTQGSPSYHSEAGRRLDANLKWKGHVLPMLFSSDSPVVLYERVVSSKDEDRMLARLTRPKLPRPPISSKPAGLQSVGVTASSPPSSTAGLSSPPLSSSNPTSSVPLHTLQHPSGRGSQATPPHSHPASPQLPAGPGASHRGTAGRGGSRTAPGAAVGLSPPARKRYAAALLSELDQERAEQAQYFQSQRATLTSAHVFTWGGRFKFNSPAQPSAAGANLAARWTPGRQRVPLRLDSRSDA